MKEYHYNGKLEFEGEYLNGKRNGKGKEYYMNSKLKFEGEYLNGDRLTGKIYDLKTNNYYDLDGGIKFEGEYLNDKIWNGANMIKMVIYYMN